jgi:peptidyl-prolyl cis-trans isomerase B (cyclophilin B)
MRVVRYICVLTALVLFASAVSSAQGQPPAKPAAPPAAKPAPAQPAAAPAGPVVVFETIKGSFEFETFPAQAPKTVGHIVGLVKKGFYNGLRIHRVVPGFVVQLGDPYTRDMTKKDAWGTGGSGTSVGVAEFSKVHKHVPGIISMAHAGDPAKADSQFFICLGTPSHLDGKHQIFGRITTGMDIVRKLEVEDRIIRATVKEGT